MIRFDFAIRIVGERVALYPLTERALCALEALRAVDGFQLYESDIAEACALRAAGFRFC